MTEYDDFLGQSLDVNDFVFWTRRITEVKHHYCALGRIDEIHPQKGLKIQILIKRSVVGTKIVDRDEVEYVRDSSKLLRVSDDPGVMTAMFQAKLSAEKTMI